MPNQEPYPSDVTDIEWELLRPLLTVPPKLGRPPRHDRRLVLNAIFYVVRSGCAWRLLPHDLPPWRLCYYYFAKWRENGLWQAINPTWRTQGLKRLFSAHCRPGTRYFTRVTFQNGL